jgi:broad specificity phosphatase PhoE
MQRARRTAELAGFPDPQVTDLLREFDYGEYEGLTSAEIRASRPGWEVYHDGCPGGESPAQVYARAQQFLELATSASAGGGDVLAFAHGHILRAVAVAWLALDVTAASEFRLDVATLSQLAATDRGRELALWNSP